MNVVVVDDNKGDRDLLIDCVNRYAKERCFGVKIEFYESGEAFLAEVDCNFIDVLFLDIFMAELSGMDIAMIMRERGRNFPIVFVTSSQEHGVKSYGVRAFDYILKPICYDRVRDCLNLLKDSGTFRAKYIVVKEARELKKVILSEINYVDYNNHYVQIHMDGSVVRTYQKFESFEQDMVKYKNFLNCFRCILVNMDKIEKVDKGFFVLKNGEYVPINRNKSKEIKAFYFDYVFGEMENSYE